MTPARVQRRREKGWKKPKDAVYVGRPTKWGNPFAPKIIPGWATASREYAVEDFTRWLAAPDVLWRNTSGGFPDRESSIAAATRIREDIHELRGKDLMCYCHTSQPCHADVLLDLANQKDPS